MPSSQLAFSWRRFCPRQSFLRWVHIMNSEFPVPFRVSRIHARAWTTCLVFAFLAAVAMFAGCGKPGPKGPTGTVTGTVTHSGKPVAGTVYFNSAATGQSAFAPLGSDGSYQLRNEFEGRLAVGEYQVSVAPAAGGGGTDIAAPPTGIDPTKGPIPKKYLSGDTSGWTASIKAGENSFDFKVE